MARKPFSGESLIGDLNSLFSEFPDFRNPLRIEIELKDFLMSGLALFSMKFSSLLQFEEEMKERKFSQLKSIYFVDRVPSDTHMRSVLDEIDVSHFRKPFKVLFNKAQRHGLLKSFNLWNQTHLLAIDGSGYFYSSSVHCPQCIEKKQKDGALAITTRC